MSELYDELICAFSLANLPTKEVENNESVILKVKSEFIVGNPAFWRHSLASTPEKFHFRDDSGGTKLTAIAPKAKNIYFIADEDDDGKYVF